MRLVSKTVTILLALGLAMTPLLAKDWPGWRGPDQNGTVTDEAFSFSPGDGLEVVWKRELGSAYSSVSVLGQQAITLFTDGTSDYLISLDARTGEEQWRYAMGKGYPAHGGGHAGPNATPYITADQVFGLSAYGNLFALDTQSGKPLWTVEIEKEVDATAPRYGYTSSPTLLGDVLVVETGGTNKMISGFDRKTGKLRWTMGQDGVQYQSPVAMHLNGKLMGVASGVASLYGFDAETGKVLWEHKMAGPNNNVSPLQVGPNRIMIRKDNANSTLVSVGKDYQVEEIWSSRQATRTFADPIFHGNSIFCYSGPHLAKLDPNNGEAVWRSRAPGDGFLIGVNNRLVIVTKRGTLHIASASSDQYEELASSELFSDPVWTPPSYANGRLFVRSLGEIACLRIASGKATTAATGRDGPSLKIPGSQFGQFIARLESNIDKQAILEEFLSDHPHSPIIENNYAHIYYHGKAQDLAMTGDMFETGVEWPLNKVEGTDFFYASVELEPDARLNYNFTRNFDERITDPRNEVVVPSIAGDVSQLAMPKWSAPSHLAEPEKRGTTETFEFNSKILENTRNITVYKPIGYDSTKRYPVVYVTYGDRAIQSALMLNSLDNLIGDRVQEMMAVFIEAPDSFQEYARDQRDGYADMVVKELIPHIDQHYSTKSDASARAYMGGDEGGYAALYAAFRHPGIFGQVAGQSTHLLGNAGGDQLLDLVAKAPKSDTRIYLDWGRYDYRNQRGGFSWVELNRAFAKQLKGLGYKVAGGEHNEAWGWASWRNRTDAILEFFFAK